MGALQTMRASRNFITVTRKVHRAALNTPLIITLHGQGFRGWMNDISEEGVGVISVAPLSPGDRISVTVNVGREEIPLTLRALVRHTCGFHHGCQFVDSHEDERQQLRELVQEAESLAV